MVVRQTWKFSLPMFNMDWNDQNLPDPLPLQLEQGEPLLQRIFRARQASQALPVVAGESLACGIL
jgi:hypothetical protein